MSETVHVLLVEDSEKDAALIVRELRKAGLDAVWERVDSSEALERALEDRRWDIVLADYELPSFDALRALHIVRADDTEVSFVVVSGTIGEDVAVEAMRAGAQDYVMKDHLARLGPLVRREIAETEVRRQRARAVSALQDAVARNAAILEAALDAVVTMDHQGRVVDFNRAAETMFGYARNEVVGREMAALIIPAALRDGHRRGLQRYLATGEGPVLGKLIEFPALRRDGSVFPAEIAITRIERAGPPMFTGFVRDVTQRTQMESRQRLLAEAGAILVASLDRAAMMQGVAELTVAYLADGCGVDLLDKRRDLERVATAARAPGEGDVSLSATAEVPRAVIWRAMRDGQVALSSTAPLPDIGSYIVAPLIARGRLLGAMTLVRTRGRQAYGPHDVDTLKELASRCSTAIDNVKLFQEVRESIQVRDDFIAIAAHELRTPLTPLRMQAESLAAKVEARRNDELSPERLEKPVRHLLRSLERLTALVERLLDFSRMRIGGRRVELEEHDLVGLAAEAVREAEGELQRPGSTVLWRVPSAPVVGRWDRQRVTLAIRNLVSNAAKFAPGKPIEVSVTATTADARLAVKDQGPGLSPEAQARIFERYQRPAPVRNYGGFGLGLWIARRVAEDHGGRIDVRSEEGRGAEFTLVLPRQPVLAAADRPFTGSEGAP